MVGQTTTLRQLEKDLIQLTCFKFETENYKNFLSGLLNLEQLEKEIKNYKEELTSYHKSRMLKIGYFDIDDLLLISLDEENHGEICIWNLEPRNGKEDLIKLNLSLTEFLYRLKEEVITRNLLVNKIELADLRRRWNKSIWEI